MLALELCEALRERAVHRPISSTDGFCAGVRLVSVVPQDMVAIPLGVAEALVVVAAPTYLREHGRPRAPGDLLAHECIRARLPSGALMRWDLGKRGDTIVEVSGRLILGTSALALQAAAAGAGITYAEAREAQPHLDRGALVTVLAEWTPPFPGHALYFPRQRLSSAAFRAFIDFVKASTSKAAPRRKR